MTIVCTINQTDLKAKKYKAAVKKSSGAAPKKRSVELLATLLKKITSK